MSGVENLSWFYFVLEYVGVGLAAIVGGTIAKKMNFDIVGFTIIALLSSLAGGVMRDVMLNDGPVGALQTPGYLIAATLGAFTAFFIDFKAHFWEEFRFYADVVTIGVWSVAGTTRGLDNDLSWIACILLGVLTATGGSMARDVVLGKVPSLFTSQKMYVFPAMLASLLSLVLSYFQVEDWIGMVVASVAASVLAMALYWIGVYRISHREERTERSIEERLAEALDISEDDGAHEIAEAVSKARDEELLDALRVYLHDKVLERAEDKQSS